MSYKRILKRVHAGLSTENSVSYIVDGYVVSSIRNRNGDNYNCVFKYPGHGEATENIEKVMNVFSLLLVFIVSLMAQNVIKVLFGSMNWLVIIEIILFIIMATTLAHSLKFMLNKNPIILKNHGAEHKVFNAAKKKGDIPTLEEARKACRFCPWCGVKVFSVILTLLLLNVILALFNLYVIPFGIVLIAGYKLPGYDPIGYFIQMTKTTVEPSDNELQLALNAYTVATEISNGRKPTKEETPTNEKLFEYLFNLNSRSGPDDKLTYEDVRRLEAFKEKIDIENEIIEVVFGTLLRWKWATERSLIIFLNIKYISI